MSTLQAAMDAWPLPDGEPFPGETIRADGWVYRDLPRMRPTLFDQFIEIAGEENLRWLTKADYGDTKRGQVFISPEGAKRLTDYAAANPSNRTENT